MLLLIILSSIILFNNLDESSLFADEAIYGLVEKDIVKNNSWLPFRIEGKPYLDKPPLKIWAVAIIFKYFGMNEFNARILDVIFGIATIALTFIFGTIFFDSFVGFIAALLLLTADKYISLYDSIFFFVNGIRASVMDSWFVFFISAALFLYLYYFDAKQANKKLLYIIGILLGAALLVKGVIAFIVIAIILLFRFFFNYKKSKFVLTEYKDVFIIGGVAFLIYLPWFFLINITTDWAYFYYMYTDLIIRATVSIDPQHIRDIFFYMKSITLDFKVWSIFIGLTPFIVLKYKNQEKIKRYLFFLIWALFIFLIFSSFTSKLVWYIYPMYPAVAILLARNIKTSFFICNKFGHYYKCILAVFIVILMSISLILAFNNSQDVRVIGVHKFLKLYQQENNPQLFIDPVLNSLNLTYHAWTRFYLGQIKNKEIGIPKLRKDSCIFFLTYSKNKFGPIPEKDIITLEYFAIGKKEDAYILNLCKT